MDTPYATRLVARVRSTQDEAKRRYRIEGTPVLVVAEDQDMGRGRYGRVWLRASRAMLSSFAGPDPWPVEQMALVPLVVGMELRRAVGELTGVWAALKWPNDLITPAGKVAGILVERSDEVVTIGCGANLWWPEPPPGMAGILDEDPGTEVVSALARAWVDGWLRAAARGPREWGREEYIEACDTVGAEVTWQPGGRGTAVGVSPTGGLVVETDKGTIELHSGEVRQIRRVR